MARVGHAFAFCLWLLLQQFGMSTGESQATEACDMSKSGNEICADFCNYRCSFFNTSLGEDGSVRNVTLYRLTPSNVTGIRNKDTGDAFGDVTFYLSKKNLTQMCARNPTTFGCFLDGDNLYGKFQVELSTQFGPYFECNPTNHGRNPIKPDWVDTQDFMCGQACLTPTPDGCKSFRPRPHKNGSDWGSLQCWCDGTARHNKTVGRELNPVSASSSWDQWGPDWWPPQCYLSYEEASDAVQKKESRCAAGTVYRQVRAWSFASTAAMACNACSLDDECDGWATHDNVTAVLFRGPVEPSSQDCIGGVKHRGSGSSWGGAGQVGGYWYSTPITSECRASEAVGTDGCSWRVVSQVYKNASCIDRLVDAKIEVHGKACFDTCGQPLNRTGNCYVLCYKNTLLGDASFNITAMTNEEVAAPWQHGFEEEDPARGGCPVVHPAPCSGPQCDSLADKLVGRIWV